ncbi:hypothetical protein [Humibacter ginsenosidimutans]|uniref:Uncharacterized protein n=1 Tax=Humibacter ginsenosidimutans TaxID=2599293 RepID=A0A5B8M346_9MICO|nr:hypothetical protein [Humibacter ginsenosidimutans]QDZ14706.1 hypothetical protein FPZ11_08010 [Humibacter ginsenosidimutans]
MSKRDEVVELASSNPISLLSGWGIRSEHAYLAAVVSLGLVFITWLVSRAKKDDRGRSEHWGLFLGEWVASLLALGVALKLEEKD